VSHELISCRDRAEGASCRVTTTMNVRQADFAERQSGTEDKMAKVSPFKFLQEVRAETEKVTWPTRRETAVTTVMVFVMSALAAVFFLLADQVIRYVVTLVLGIGS
jgi:preprotein translocase subunit SecE